MFINHILQYFNNVKHYGTRTSKETRKRTTGTARPYRIAKYWHNRIQVCYCNIGKYNRTRKDSKQLCVKSAEDTLSIRRNWQEGQKTKEQVVNTISFPSFFILLMLYIDMLDSHYSYASYNIKELVTNYYRQTFNNIGVSR